MNKLELIDALKKECKISKKDAAAIVDLFFDKTSDALARGGRIEIRGLCSLTIQMSEQNNKTEKRKKCSIFN